jgi:hypothetical protein
MIFLLEVVPYEEKVFQDTRGMTKAAAEEWWDLLTIVTMKNSFTCPHPFFRRFFVTVIRRNEYARASFAY